MAKVINQKKRVARIKSGLDDDIEDGCRDYVSSIIKEMDSNFITVQSNRCSRSSVVSSIETAKDFKYICGPSTNKASTKVSNILKSKSFGLQRKFPLMEKSQKILKHIRHNQSIPKQRAHVASLSKSPIKRFNACNKLDSIRKKNQKQNIIKRNINVVTDKPINVVTDKPSSTDKFSINIENRKQTISSVLEVKKVNKSDVKESTYSENSYNNDENIDDDNGSTTDSEYERFLQNNKKHLKKRKKQKSLIKTSHTSRKKQIPPKLSTKKTTQLNNYQLHDEVSYTNQYKRRKKTRKDMSYKERQPSPHFSDSESHLINESFTRDTSSDSDLPSIELVTKDSVDFELVDKAKSEDNLTNQKHPSYVETEMITNFEYASSNGTLNAKGAKENYPESFKESHNFNISNRTPKTDNNNSENILPFNQPILPEKNKFEAQPREEESDIEIVEVIKPQSKNNAVIKEEADKNFKDIQVNEISSLSSVHTKEQQDSQIQLKFEDQRQKEINYVTKIKNNEKMYSTDIHKEFNPVTDSKANILKQHYPCNKILVQDLTTQHIDLKKEDSDDDIIIVDCVLNKKSKSFDKDVSEVKMEISDTVNCTTNYLNIKTEDSSKSLTGESKRNLSKNENIILKDLQLYEAALAHTVIPGEATQKLIPLIQPKETIEEKIDVKKLLDLFKKEFQIYQEIIQAEVNVEKSLKTIESYQAEKLKNIRSLIQKVVENKPCFSEDENSKIQEQKFFLHKYEEVSKLATSENKISTEFSSKNIHNFKDSCLHEIQSTINTAESFFPKYSVTHDASSQSNLFPSTSVEKDVKPNLSILNNMPKSTLTYSTVHPKMESMPVQELPASTIKLLGEKCNVCGKEAVAACQRCAKVFFCSNECGKKFWIDGHENKCG